MNGIGSHYISVVVPLFNDADILPAVLDELASELNRSFEQFEIILVDDASTDQTGDIARHYIGGQGTGRYIRLSRSFRQEIAVAAGLDAAIGDLVVVLDPATDSPVLIGNLVARALKDDVDILYAIRPPQSGLLFQLASKLFYTYCNRFLSLDLPENTTLLRVMSRRAVTAICRRRDRLRHVRLFISYVGYRRQSYPYTPIDRRGGEVRRSFYQALVLGIEIIVASSAQPLRLAGWVSTGMSALSAMVFIHLVYTATGWQEAFTEFYVTMIGAFICLVLALICHYLARTFDNHSEAPLYYVEEDRMGILNNDSQRNVTYIDRRHRG